MESRVRKGMELLPTFIVQCFPKLPSHRFGPYRSHDVFKPHQWLTVNFKILINLDIMLCQEQ